MDIVLVGGGGFLGRYLVHELVADGHRCTVLSRHADRRAELRLEPATRLEQADVHDPAALSECLRNADAVISMAGILNEGVFSRGAFEKVHFDLPRSIVNACRAHGITRLLHVSALNAGKGDSRYLQTKGRAEEMLRAEEGLEVTIFQPSVIFGPGDSFFNRFATLLQVAPVMPLACGGSKMQPVYAGDVAAAVAESLEDPATFGRTYELGGPGVYTLKELVQFTAKVLGIKRTVVSLPDFLSRLQGLVMGLVPGQPFSLDNYRSLKTDNVTGHNGLPSFGIVPASIEAVVPGYLGISVRQRRLGDIRRHAGR